MLTPAAIGNMWWLNTDSAIANFKTGGHALLFKTGGDALLRVFGVCSTEGNSAIANFKTGGPALLFFASVAAGGDTLRAFF